VSSPGLIPTFSTAVNTWQCDENDHLNVQFYTEFGHEASAHLMISLGFGRRTQAAAGLSVRATSDHIRYLREFRAVDPVAVRSAPVEVGERHLVIYHEVRNSGDDALASTVRRHVLSDKPWPAAFRKQAEAACLELPAAARPRGITGVALPDLALADAAGIGLLEVGRGTVKPFECDENGEMLPRHQTGRYSDGAPIVWNRMGFDRAAMAERQEGSVVVEMMQYYRRPLSPGDAVIVMSGLADHSDKTIRLAHFLFEAETGTLAACAEAVGVKFDQKVRKVMAFSEQERTLLANRKLRW
jgi:acyl-CoA thioester hydrolase